MNPAFGDGISYVVGWTLIHSVWQVVLAGVINLIAQNSLKRADVSVRYAVAATCLTACLFGAITTFTMLLFSTGWVGEPTLLSNGFLSLVTIPAISPFWKQLVFIGEEIAPYVFGLWAMWVLIRWAQIFGALYRLNKMLAGDLPALAIEPLPNLARIQQKLVPGKKIRYVRSSNTTVPTTAGIFEPVVVLPEPLLRQFNPSRVEALIAHELAHVGRRDYSINLVQLLVVSLFGRHPTVTRLNRHLVELRNKCCDELAVDAIGGDFETYALALSDLDSDRKLSPLMMGATDGGSLLSRLESLADKDSRRSKKASMFQAGVLCLFLLACVGVAGQTLAARSVTYRDVALATSATMPATIYNLLGANHDNRYFVPAVANAVELLRQKRFDRGAALSLASAVNDGSKPDALMTAALPFYQPSSYSISRTTGWMGGGSLRWDDLAAACFNFAKTNSSNTERHALVCCAILLGAQERLTSGGYLQRLVIEPDFAKLSGLTPHTIEAIRIAVSNWAQDVSITSSKYNAWENESPTTIPAWLRQSATSRPWLQFRIANLIDGVSKTSPSRATSLTNVARDGSCEIAVRLVENATSYSSSDSSKTKVAPKHGPVVPGSE